MSIDSQAYVAALEGKEEEARALVKLGANINCVIMGASDGKHKKLQQWAFENGACFVFSFQSSSTESIVQHKYGKNLSMLRGPGDVPKGTFIKA